MSQGISEDCLVVDEMIPSPMWALGTHQLTVPSLLSLPDFMEFHSMEAHSSIQQRLHISIALFLLSSLLFRTCSVISSCCRLPKFWSLFPHFRENHHPLLWDFPSCFLCILVWLVPSGKNSGVVGRLISSVFLFLHNLCCPIPENSCFRHFVQFLSYLRLEDKLDSSSWLEGKDLCIF